MTNDVSQTYRLLKSDLAAKLSPRSRGGITYILLADLGDWPDLHIAITANEGGGLWSKEAIPLSAIESIVDAFNNGPFPTRALREATVGRSSNNAPFCLAVLKDLGLAQVSPTKRSHYVKAGDWEAFRNEWLMKDGEEIVYPARSADPLDENDFSDRSNKAADAEPATSTSRAASATGRRKKLSVKAISSPDQEANHETSD